MPEYDVELYELHAMTFRVTAENEIEAVDKAFKGHGIPSDEGSYLVEHDEDHGIPIDECPELAEGLQKLGYQIGKDDFIGGLRSVQEV